MDNTNQQPLSPQQPIEQVSAQLPSSGPSKTFIILIVLILITAFGVGGYFLGANQNQVAQDQTQPVLPTPQPSPTPVDETAREKIYTIGDITVNLPEGWKLRESEYSTEGDEYLYLYSPDLEPPFPEGSGIGAIIHIRRQKTELIDTGCDPNEKISDEFERSITSDIKCIKINGKDIKSKHIDYEGHYLDYSFIYKGSLYSFNLQTSGVLKTENNYLPFLESVLDSINFE